MCQTKISIQWTQGAINCAKWDKLTYNGCSFHGIFMGYFPPTTSFLVVIYLEAHSFRNKRFMFNEMLQRNTSKFAKYINVIRKSYLSFSISCNFTFSLMNVNFLIHKILQILKHLGRANSWAQTTYFWRMSSNVKLRGSEKGRVR